MREAISLMGTIREMPSLDQQIELFSALMRDEFKYDGFVYGAAIDGSSAASVSATFLMKQNGMSDEWMGQYAAEGLVARDVSMPHIAARDGVMQMSRVQKAADQGDMPDQYCEVPKRARDFVKSGFILSVKSSPKVGGFGLHSSIMMPDQHDAQFVKNGHLIVELCRQFHEITRWKTDILATTGLSEMNLKVLELRSHGLMAKQIIEITGHEHENSVAQHMKQVRQKLRTKNEKQTLIRAASLGLIGRTGFSEASLEYLEDNARAIAEREKWLGEIV